MSREKPHKYKAGSYGYSRQANSVTLTSIKHEIKLNPAMRKHYEKAGLLRGRAKEAI